MVARDSPDQQALCQGGADVLLGEAGDQLADGQAVPSAQSVQQRHSMELHHEQAGKLSDSSRLGVAHIYT